MMPSSIRDPEGAKLLLAKLYHGDTEEKEEMQIQANIREEIFDCCQCRWISKAATSNIFSALSSEDIFINLILFGFESDDFVLRAFRWFMML